MRSTTTAYYKALWETMKVRPEWRDNVKLATKRVLSHRDLYEGLIADWRLVGVIHLMESSCNPKCQILNGQPWTQMTTKKPRGLGPFKSWQDAAKIALSIHPLKTLCDIERWNGLAYAKRNRNSPYLWSGSTHYDIGKFAADGVFDPNLKSKQVGACLVLRELEWDMNIILK